MVNKFDIETSLIGTLLEYHLHFCTQYRKEDWHNRLGGGVHADAIMDRIVHNAVWVETGSMNMREYYSKQSYIR